MTSRLVKQVLALDYDQLLIERLDTHTRTTTLMQTQLVLTSPTGTSILMQGHYLWYRIACTLIHDANMQTTGLAQLSACMLSIRAKRDMASQYYYTCTCIHFTWYSPRYSAHTVALTSSPGSSC